MRYFMKSKFYCEPCCFESNDRTNFKRHLETKRHRNFVGKVSNVILKKSARGAIKSVLIGEDIETFSCKYCGYKSSKKSSINKHENKCLAKKLDEVIKERDRSQAMIQEKDKKINHYEREIRIYQSTIELKNENEKQKTSKIKFINKNYKPETNLKELPYSEFKSKRRILYIDEPKTKNDGIVQDAIYSYEHNTLDSYVGNVVMDKYEDLEPEDKEIWVTDVVRLKFIVRKKRNIYYKRGKKKGQIKSVEYYWYDDCGGEYTCEKIIEPTLFQLRYLLSKYQRRFNKEEYKKARTSYEQGVFMKKNESILSIIRSIDDKKLHKKILRYIAPKMVLRKNENENEDGKENEDKDINDN